MGVDYLESDLQCSKDGIIIANHDDNLKRTTNIDKLFGSDIPTTRIQFYESLGLLVPMCYLIWLNTPPEPGDFALTTTDGFTQAIKWALDNGAHIIGPSIAGEPNNYSELNAPWQAQLTRRSGMLNHPYSFDTNEQMKKYVGTADGDIAADGCFTNRSDLSLQYLIDHGFRGRAGIPDPFHQGCTYDNSQAARSVPDAVQTLQRLGY
jgi:glycerophosphoryl diester phosphodiesterase